MPSTSKQINHDQRRRERRVQHEINVEADRQRHADAREQAAQRLAATIGVPLEHARRSVAAYYFERDADEPLRIEGFMRYG